MARLKELRLIKKPDAMAGPESIKAMQVCALLLHGEISLLARIAAHPTGADLTVVGE